MSCIAKEYGMNITKISRQDIWKAHWQNYGGYVDNRLIKSIKEEDYFKHLGEIFVTMKRYGIKLNPNECMCDV